MPAPTHRQIAEHLGVSRVRATQLKAMGMPTNSLRAAKLWRDKQAKKREATNSKSATLQSKRAGRPRKVKRSKPAKTDDSLRDSLTDAITIEHDAFEAYQDAKMSEPSAMSPRLSEFNKALKGRQEAERLYREEQERRGVLVAKQEVIELCRRALDTVLRRLKKVPGEAGPQCNPQDPLMATSILQRSMDEIMLACHSALNGL